MQLPSFKLNNGLSLPAIGFGTWDLRGADAYASALHALKSGYRLIDSAEFYQNEPAVGRAIRNCGIPRAEIFVTTKLWQTHQGDPMGAFRRSLTSLGLSYADIYLLHWPFEKRVSCFKSLQSLVRDGDGMIRTLGVSNFTIRHLKELEAETGTVPSVNQVEFSPFLYQKELLDYCKKKGIQLEAYSPLTRNRKLSHPTISEIAQKHGRTPAQIVLRWHHQHGIIPIPKSRTQARIEENLRIFAFSLSQKEMGALNSLNENFRVTWDPEDEP